MDKKQLKRGKVRVYRPTRDSIPHSGIACIQTRPGSTGPVAAERLSRVEAQGWIITRLARELWGRSERSVLAERDRYPKARAGRTTRACSRNGAGPLSTSPGNLAFLYVAQEDGKIVLHLAPAEPLEGVHEATDKSHGRPRAGPPEIAPQAVFAEHTPP